jgi:hypothetical protein
MNQLDSKNLKITKTIFPDLDFDDINEWVQLLDIKLKNRESVNFDKHLPERNYD